MNKWQIILSNEDSTYGDHTCVAFPEGFEDIMYGLVRDSVFWGVFSEFAGTLRFIKDGKDWIDAVIDDLGYENGSSIYFKKYSETNGQYETKKIATFDAESIIITQNYTEVGFLDSSFITKLRSRYEYSVEYNKSTTIDGTSVPGFSTPYIDLGLRGIAAETNCRAIPPWELFTSVIQQITDSDYNCFSSLIFDRDVSGKFSQVMFANGWYVRGYDETEHPFNISLKFLFKEFSKLVPLGLKVVYDDNDREIVYIGLRNELFIESVVYTFPKDRVLKGMVKEPCKEFMFNKIKAGYANEVKENDIGLSEFNVKTEYSTPIISFNNELNIISDIRADGTGIEDCRVNYAKESGDDTSESEYDDSIFIIDSVEDGSDWVSRKLENIQNSGSAYIYGGLELYFNIRFTPAHNVLAYGEYIGVGLQNKTEEQIKILMHEKLSSEFQSQWVDDSDVVYENTDISIARLATPIFSPHIYRFNCPIELDDLADLESSLEGLIKFYSPIDSAWKYGYIEKDISTSPIDTKTNVNLYEALSFDELFGCLLLFTGGYLRLFSGGRIKLFGNG